MTGVRTRLTVASSKRAYLTLTIDPKEKSALIVAVFYFKEIKEKDVINGSPR